MIEILSQQFAMLLNPIPLPPPETATTPLEGRLADIGAGGSFVVVGVDGDDALSRRFEEALKQASKEPVTRPTRDFDLD